MLAQICLALCAMAAKMDLWAPAAILPEMLQALSPQSAPVGTPPQARRAFGARTRVRSWR